MAINWTKIATKIDSGLKGLGSTSTGYTAALRRVTLSGGDPFNPGSQTPTITYYTLYCVSDESLVKDQQGTLIDQKNRTLNVTTGSETVPTDEDQVYIGVSAADLDTDDDATYPWEGIAEVLTVSPAGTPLLYTLLLET